MDSDRLTYLFHRFINSKCTDAEKAEFLDLVRETGHEKDLESLMDGLWFEDSGKTLESGRARDIVTRILTVGQDTIPRRKSRFFFPLGKIAASLVFVVLCTGGTLYYLRNQGSSAERISQVEPDRTQPGFIKLPDGSTVILNGASKLEFPHSFDGLVREVTLTGEGFFDISHDATRPFVVHTGKVKTTVLGTAFNIKAYPDQSDITVTVTRGKVKVSDDKQVFGIVNPDQQITFNKNRELVEQKTVDSQKVTAWMEKDIYFEDVTIGQAVDQLERRFGISITLSNKNIGNCKFTATFVKGEDIEQILRILCDFNNATLLTKGTNDFEIHGGECPL